MALVKVLSGDAIGALAGFVERSAPALASSAPSPITAPIGATGA